VLAAWWTADWVAEEVPPGGEPRPAQQRVSKRVLVVGAGPSGLAALKEMLQHGHDAMAVEGASEIGGVFGLNSAKLYEGLHLTSSNFFTAFSDFPPLDDAIRYWTAREYGEYLVRYAKHFGLLSRIRLDTQVIRARLSSDEKWEVVVQGSDGQTEQLVFEGLVVATGTNQEPHTPEFPGFSGQVVHSAHYNNSLPFAGKRVLAVGTGESGSDVAGSLTQHAKSVTVWARRPPLIAPRFLGTGERESSLLGRTDMRPMQLLEAASSSRARSSLSHFSNALLMWRLLWPKEAKAGDQRRIQFDWYNIHKDQHPELYWQAEFVAAPTKNYRLAEMAHAGEAEVVVAKTAKFNSSTVTFTDVLFANKSRTEMHERSFKIDAIVCSCGYKMNIKWLEVDVEMNPRTWFKHAFPPKHGDKLFMAGFARPHQGSLPAASELVARYGAMVFSGERELPQGYESIAFKEGLQEDELFKVDPKLKSLVDFSAFTETMTEMIGCKAKTPSIFNFQRWLQYNLYARFPAWFRAEGPHAKPEVIDGVLEKFPYDLKDLFPFHAMYLGLAFVQTPINVMWRTLNHLMGRSMDNTAPGWQFGQPMKGVLHRHTLGGRSMFSRA